MKFINLTSVSLMLLMLGIWLYWKPPAALIRLKEIEAVPAGEVRQQVEPTLWDRLAFRPDLTKQDSLSPADYYLKQWRTLAIKDYDVVQVELDGQTRYFKAEVIDADSIWDRERIPDSQKFPYRMASYPLAAAVLLVIGFRKRIFGKQKPLVAYTAVGSGYRISQGILLMALLLLSLPITYQVSNNTMGAVGFGGGILLLTGLIAFPIYAKAASELHNRFHEGGTEVLAEWLIPRDEWLSFLQHSVRKDIKKLMIILGAITVFGLVSAHLVSQDEPNEWMVMVTIAAILTIIWLVTLVPALLKTASSDTGQPDSPSISLRRSVGNGHPALEPAQLQLRWGGSRAGARATDFGPYPLDDAEQRRSGSHDKPHPVSGSHDGNGKSPGDCGNHQSHKPTRIH
jgi:hypothetical protein